MPKPSHLSRSTQSRSFPNRTVTTLLLLAATPSLVGASPSVDRSPATRSNASAPDAPPPPSDDHAPPSLFKLRDALGSTTLAAAREQLPRFRPLCDDEGYPLVGNVASKNERTQPSDFCADVRKRRA